MLYQADYLVKPAYKHHLFYFVLIRKDGGYLQVGHRPHRFSIPAKAGIYRQVNKIAGVEKERTYILLQIYKIPASF
jgi:hypothetical protein